MAERPWVYPLEVKAYSDSPAVASRTDAKLDVDISRAEQYVIKYTNNDFTGASYTAIPEPVKNAVVLLAEMYANNAVERTKDMKKSESFDDYSYTNERAVLTVEDLDIAALLDPYVTTKGSGKVTFKLTRL